MLDFPKFHDVNELANNALDLFEWAKRRIELAHQETQRADTPASVHAILHNPQMDIYWHIVETLGGPKREDVEGED